jgi:hypothetical protein
MNDQAYFAELERLESLFHMPRIWINTETGAPTFEQIWTSQEAEQLYNRLLEMYPYTQDYHDRMKCAQESQWRQDHDTI